MIKCDTCNKSIEKGFSEFCLFHHRKRRDFDSLMCVIIWVEKYLNEKGLQKSLFSDWVKKEMDELIKKGKSIDKLEFLRLVFLSGVEVGGRKIE